MENDVEGRHKYSIKRFLAAESHYITFCYIYRNAIGSYWLRTNCATRAMLRLTWRIFITIFRTIHASAPASLVIQISVIASLPPRSLAFLGPVRDGVRWAAELNRK